MIDGIVEKCGKALVRHNAVRLTASELIDGLDLPTCLLDSAQDLAAVLDSKFLRRPIPDVVPEGVVPELSSRLHDVRDLLVRELVDERQQHDDVAMERLVVADRVPRRATLVRIQLRRLVDHTSCRCISE